MRLLITFTALALAANVALADEHVVEMKNMGTDGTMVFEPAVVRAAVGDTVRFVPTDMAHNSESIEGLIPEGASAWKGTMSQEVTVTLEQEGVYVYQCLPHLALAMVGVIVAGEPTNLEQIKADSAMRDGKIFANKERLSKYLAEAADAPNS